MNDYVWVLLGVIAALLVGCVLVDLLVRWADVIVDRHVERAFEQPWDEEEWT